MKKPAFSKQHPRDSKGRFITLLQAGAIKAEKAKAKAARELSHRKRVSGYTRALKAEENRSKKNSVYRRWKNGIQTVISKYGVSEKDAYRGVAEYMARYKEWENRDGRGERPVYESPIA